MEYYSLRKAISIKKLIREFTQGSSETFHKAMERLRNLTKECTHHGISNHELTQKIFNEFF